MFQLTNDQLKKLSDIASDIGMLALASVILPSILNKFNALLVIIGSLWTLIAWLASLWLLKNKS